ncbi:MAG: ABC transporter permease, partial [Clostridia bacterium]|nr:ABC transporter permease [Clostridia bacterium]
TNNASTFTANAGVFGKVYFPRLTVPISNMLSSIVQFFVQMLLVVGFMIYYLIVGQVSPIWWAWALIPVALVHLGVFG